MMFSLMQITRGVVTSFIKRGLLLPMSQTKIKSPRIWGNSPKMTPKPIGIHYLGIERFFVSEQKNLTMSPPHKKNEKNNKGL